MSGLAPVILLRRELSERNRAFAQKYGLRCQESYGASPTVVYEPDPDLHRHGNFFAKSYRAILANREWDRRFKKTHTQKKALPPAAYGTWRELDSCNSSDALLMNVFCYPNIFQRSPVLRVLGISQEESPEFGFKARVPLRNGRLDRTEVDLRIGDLLIEAKLTEANFQSRAKQAAAAYRDFAEVFESRLLPQSGEDYFSYQLIRNVLAAFATHSRFCVLLDARRPDLIEAWHAVQRAIRPAELRVRCSVLTWQELASALPPSLARFLSEKYGIHPRG